MSSRRHMQGVSTYLFDTNAVRGLPRRVLQRAASANRATVSPYVLYELTTQLDLTDEQTFVRTRGGFLKATELELLPDPNVDVAREVGLSLQAAPRAVAHYQLIQGLVRCLQESKTLGAFCDATIMRDDGAAFPCPAYVRMVAGYLADVECHHVSDVERMRQRFVACLESDPTFDLTVENLMHIGVGASHLIGQEMLDRGALGLAPASTVFVRSFLSIAYTAFQALRAARSGPQGKIQPNDAEDAVLLLHLDLREEWVWISSEKQISAALRFAVERLTQALDIIGSSSRPTVTWVTADELRAQMAAELP